MLNQGVIHTYLMCHKSRRAIFSGNATMLSNRKFISENCRSSCAESLFAIAAEHRIDQAAAYQIEAADDNCSEDAFT